KQQDQKRKELTNSRSNTEYSESESEKELIIIDKISELPPDQYKITKNILFYLKQQETKKIQEFLGQDPKNTKGNYPNNANNPEERKELARFYKATSASFDMYDRFDYELYFTCKKETMIQRQKERSQPEEKEIPQGYLEQLWDIYDDNIEKIYPNYIRIPTDIQDPHHIIRSLFIHEAKGLRRIEEKPIRPSMNEYIKNLPITGYALIILFDSATLNTKY
ncbi:7344_t:CDS:2, partial [Gigaspora rosea]